MRMMLNGKLSTRWRVLAPVAAGGIVVGRHARAGAQEVMLPALGEDRLSSLLALVPGDLVGSLENGLIATYADIAAQLAAGGIAPPASVDDEEGMRRWIRASSPLLIAEPLGSYALNLTRDLIGFDVTDVDQTLEAGEPPEMITLLRGRFDREAVAAAWDRNGYARREVAGVDVASLSEDAEIDFESELGRMALARMNNAAFLPDGTLVYTPSLDLMRQVIAAVRGDAASLAQRVDIRTLLAAQVDDLVTGILFPGLALAGLDPALMILDPDVPSTMATEIASLGEMPPIALGLLGITAGGPLPLPITGEATPDPSIPAARVIYRLLMQLPGTAERAGEVARARLETMDSITDRKPYRELFASWETRVLADGQVLQLELTLPPGMQAGVWSRHFFARDVRFLAW